MLTVPAQIYNNVVVALSDIVITPKMNRVEAETLPSAIRKNQMSKKQILTLQDLAASPVWAESDDDGLVPIGAPNPLPLDQGQLAVAAVFDTLDGLKFDGYVFTLGSVFSIVLLVDGDSFHFNANVPDLVDDERNRLSKMFPDSFLVIFPLTYKTEFTFPGDGKVGGVFDPK